MKHRITAVAAALALGVLAAGCSNMPEDVSPRTGTLAGAAAGATAGALLSSGVIAPALGAIGGAAIGEQAAQNDPAFR